MGNCHKSKGFEDVLIYRKSISIFIKQEEFKSKFIQAQKVKFCTTEPTKEVCEFLELGSWKFKISSCVIPGQDPRGEIEKICQDNVLISHKQEMILVSIFDGHGPQGKEVVDFAESFVNEFFQNQDFAETSEEKLSQMFVSCDSSLRSSSSEINCFGSGTTAVSIVFTTKGIFTANVGDSRAILATWPEEKYIPEPEHSQGPYKKIFKPLRILKPIQLTIDQKPNLEEELNRIIISGGVVSKVKDSEGNYIGPYRVYQKGKQLPGLAMSRSLGDGAAKKVGVIPNPITKFYPLSVFRDQFIIIGSDGVWDVMTNAEAVNFVETFRAKCLKSPVSEYNECVTQENSTIARLLAEEARYRWFGICSEEDVLIDDISVIVVEIVSKELGSDVDEVNRMSQDFGRYLDVKSKDKVYSSRNTLANTKILDDMVDLNIYN